MKQDFIQWENVMKRITTCLSPKRNNEERKN